MSEQANVMDAIYAEVVTIRNDVGYLMGEVVAARDAADRTTNIIDEVNSRVSWCEAEIHEIRQNITHEVIREVARRLCSYFDTTANPVSDEEFAKDLQELLFG